MKIDIYVTLGCPFCRRMWEWLDGHDVEYKRHVFTDLGSKLDFYKEHNVSTVPQMFVDGKRIGGWSDFNGSELQAQLEEEYNR